MEAPPRNPRTGVGRGDVIGRKYVVDHVIGEGRTGVVVAAHHRELRTKAAIKIGRKADRESSARFQREAHAMARLESPYTVRVFDVGELTDGRPYMVMEYLDGRDLGTMLAEQGPLPVEDTLRWMLQASEAIEEAHDVGILHRDLGPHALFLANESPGSALSPTIRVLDFGFSPVSSGLLERIESGKARGLRPGDVPGTSYFMAPEQVRGERLDRRTDVWGLGATLFYLLTKRHPFPGAELAEVCKKILGEPPADMRASGREIPSPVEAAVLRCLQKQLGDRFENMAALRTALREARDEMRNTPMVVAAARARVHGDVGQRVSEPPPTPVVPMRKALLDETRPGQLGDVETGPPSSDSVTRVAPPVAVADPSDEDTTRRLGIGAADAATLDEETVVQNRDDGKRPRRLRLPSPMDDATEVKPRDAPSPAKAAAAARESAVPLEKLVENVPVRLGPRTNVAKPPARPGVMPSPPLARTAREPEESDPEAAEIVDLVERRHLEDRIQVLPFEDRVEGRATEDSEPDDAEPSSVEPPTPARASDRPPKAPDAEIEAVVSRDLPAPRARMHALHDYRPPRSRKSLVAGAVVSIAAVAIVASAWTLRGRGSNVEVAAAPASTAPRTPSSSSSTARRTPEPPVTAPSETPASSAPSSASASTSAVAATSSSPPAASATAPATETTKTSESPGDTSEPAKTTPPPSPKPRAVRAAAPAQPRPTSRENDGDGTPWSTSRGGSTPATTTTSSILDKRK